MDDLEDLQVQELEAYKTNSTPNQEKKQPNPKRKQIDESKAKVDFEGVETVKGTRYLLKGFRFLGLYIPKTNRAFYIGWSLIMNTLITVYAPIGFLMTFIMAERFELSEFLTPLPVIINAFGCSAKAIIMGFLLPRLLNCEPIFKKLDKRCSTEEELKSLKALIKNGNRLVLMFATSYLSYSSSKCVGGIISHRLPFNIYNPFVDAEASNYHFSLAMLIDMVLIDLVIFQQVVDDSYAVIYVNILRTHLDILMKRITKLNTTTKESPQKNYEELKLCIIDHKNLVELYNTIASVISITIFVQFTITASVLSTTLLNILIFNTDFASVVASCIYILAVVMETFPLCYCAQCLMDESSRLSDVIFHSQWVDQDRRYRQVLIFFIQRSQNTFEFTAGKLIPITMNSFLSIAKFSFTLYTFIKEMGIVEKFGQ